MTITFDRTAKLEEGQLVAVAIDSALVPGTIRRIHTPHPAIEGGYGVSITVEAVNGETVPNPWVVVVPKGNLIPVLETD